MIKRLLIFLGFVFWLIGPVIGQEDGILINTPSKVKSGDEFLMVISVPENWGGWVLPITFSWALVGGGGGGH